VPDWRWLLERDDNPWYAAMRVFRQPQVGDWPAVFDAIGRQLRDAAAGAQRPASGQ
jgi:hypothetical protein